MLTCIFPFPSKCPPKKTYTCHTHFKKKKPSGDVKSPFNQLCAQEEAPLFSRSNACVYNENARMHACACVCVCLLRSKSRCHRIRGWATRSFISLSACVVYYERESSLQAAISGHHRETPRLQQPLSIYLSLARHFETKATRVRTHYNHTYIYI